MYGRIIVSLAVLSALALCNVGQAKAVPLTAFYVPWDIKGRADLARHIAQIDIFAPFWITLKTPDGIPTITDDPEIASLLASTRHAPVVMPVIANAHDGIWDGTTADAIIVHSENRTVLISTLLKLATERKFGGYIFDLENLSPASLTMLPSLVSEITSAFKPAHLDIWFTVPLESSGWPIRAMQDAGATIVLMAYDQCCANSTPGPIAANDWFGSTLAARMRGMDRTKTIIALGSYAYDWPKGLPAKVLSVDDAIRLANDNNTRPISTPPQLNPAFTYDAADGVPHVVWMLNGDTFHRQRQAALHYNPKGIALWRLGLEDKTVWTTHARISHVAISNGVQPTPVCFSLPKH